MSPAGRGVPARRSPRGRGGGLVAGAAVLVLAVLRTLTEAPSGRRAAQVATLSVAEALPGAGPRATRARWRRGPSVPRGPRAPSGVPHRVVVLDGQSRRRRTGDTSATSSRSSAARWRRTRRAARSDWGARQVYLAHFAVTDARGGRFHFGARISRGALGLAGAQAEPFRVWLEDWEAGGDGTGDLSPAPARARTRTWRWTSCWRAASRRCCRATAGLSRKGPEPGNASYYYSLTRMPARGTVRLGTERLRGDGLAWMDREWSTSALGKDQVGWDWFALQLADGRELMYYQLRRQDGAADPFSAGVVVAARGGARALTRDGVRLEATGVWRAGGAGSVSRRLAARGTAGRLELTITPRLADQELHVSLRYWEGAVEVRGTEGGQPVAGRGYVELVGYGEAGRRPPTKQ